MNNNISYLESRTCRICANFYILPDPSLTFVNLFEPLEGIVPDLEFIQTQLNIWNIKIAPNDGLPQLICAECFQQFRNVNIFQQKCINAQEKLIQTFLQACNEQIELLPDNNILMPAVADVTPVLAQSCMEEDSANAQPNDLNQYAVFQQNYTNYCNATLLNSTATPTAAGNNVNSQSKTENTLDFIPSVTTTSANDYNKQCQMEGVQLFYEEAVTMPELNFVSKEEDCIGQSKNMEDIVSEDLEEMLQSNIIPTKSNDIIKRVNAIDDDNAEESPKVIPHNEQNGMNRHHAAVESSDDDYDDEEDENTDAISSRLSHSSFACQYCFCPPVGAVGHLIFSDSDALSQHFFDVHDPNSPYTCPQCTQSYRTARKRNNHIRNYHKPPQQQQQHTTSDDLEQCKYCKKRIRRPMEVHQYICQYVGDWECNICDEKFPQIPLCRFSQHQRQHEPPKQFHCSICNRLFVRRANMEAHERMHKQQAAKMRICDECKGAFSGEYELRRHKYQAHNGELPVQCDYCYKGFVSMAFLVRHQQHFHPEKLDANNLDAATCNNCGITFSSVHKLRYHMQRPRDENGKCLDTSGNFKEKRRIQRQGVYPCPFCAKRFHLKPQLEKHLNTHDVRLRPHQCDQCQVRCRTPFELKQHVDIAHLNIKAFECSECGKCFGVKRELQDHMLFHAEVTVCCPEEDCKYICKNAKALNDHIRHKHRPIACEYCNETFTRQRLTTHLRNVHRAEIDVEIHLEANALNNNINNSNNDNDNDNNETNSNMTDNNTCNINMINSIQLADNNNMVSAAAAAAATTAATVRNGDKVRVELLNGHVTTTNLLEGGLQEQVLSTNDNLETFFMGSILDPDNEIIVT